ncbi:MAG: CapA family protein [Syntrophobacteraceae bacterium]|nr:CapA family protein [Syntrophobacteraceae bacterium]
MFFVLLISSCHPHPRVTLALLGDINLGRDVIPQSDSFSFLESSLSIADLVLANLESPLGDDTTIATGGYDLCAPPDRAQFLSSWGIDILSLVNNHADDCSPDGAETTLSALSTFGLTGLSSQPLRMEFNDLPLAFFAFDDVSAELNEEAAVESIRLAHAAGALVIVSIHWGWEYQGAPSSRQQDLAVQFAEAGANLIWGHHSHVLQPAEWMGTEWGQILVLYSLGNALFDQGGLEDTRQSALGLGTLDGDGVTGVETVPFAVDVPHSRILQPDAETSQEILDRLEIP